MRTFCTGYNDIAQFAQPDTNGMGKQQTIKTIAQTYRNMSRAADKASTRLGKLPDPTFAKSKRVETGVQDWLHAVATVYGKGAKTIASGSYDTPSDLKTAVDKIEAKVTTAVTDLKSAFAGVGTNVRNSMLAMPECNIMLNGQ